MAERFVLPVQSAFDTLGVPVSGAKLNFYITATSTRLDTYSDNALSSANANPVVADSAGRFGDIFMKNQDYKVVLTDSADVQIWSKDPVHGGAGTSGLSVTATGSVTSRTLEARFAEVANVLDFGAVGDGATDDTAEIQAAIDTGLPVYFPATSSYYLTSAALTADSDGQLFFGDGRQSYIRCDTADINIFSVDNLQGIAFANLRMRAFGASSADLVGNCILARTVTDFSCEALWLENARNGIVLVNGTGGGNDCKRAIIRGIHAKDMIAQYGVYMLGVSEVSVSNSVFENMTYGVLTNLGNSSQKCNDITVDGCVVDSSAYSGVGVGQGIQFNQTDRGSISNCTVRQSTGAGAIAISCPNSTGIAITGNYVTGAGASGITVSDGAEQITVANNVLETVTTGIDVAPAADSTIAITGNTIKDYNGVGLRFSAGVQVAVNATVSGNVLSNGTGANLGIQINLMKGVVVSGNTVRGADTIGIQVVDSEMVTVLGNNVIGSDGDGIQINNSLYCTIIGNVVIDNNEANAATTNGITLSGVGADDCVIMGNICRNVEASGFQDYGISANVAVDNLTIIGNLVANNDTGAILISSSATNVTAANNNGDRTGSATFDPSSLADGAGETTTVTVTGALLGDFAEASFSLDLQGITMTAWVSAADTVSVRFQNETTGTLDLASGTLRASVTRRT